jgi:hypothetical protein
VKLMAVAAGLAVALVLLPVVPVAGGPATVMAASPDATPPPGGGDPRSVGEGPGLVGDPLFAVLLVVAIGALAAGLTALYVWATGGPRTGPPTGPPGARQR